MSKVNFGGNFLSVLRCVQVCVFGDSKKHLPWKLHIPRAFIRGNMVVWNSLGQGTNFIYHQNLGKWSWLWWSFVESKSTKIPSYLPVCILSHISKRFALLQLENKPRRMECRLTTTQRRQTCRVLMPKSVYEHQKMCTLLAMDWRF